MNIETTQKLSSSQQTTASGGTANQNNSDVKFTDELKNLKSKEESKTEDKTGKDSEKNAENTNNETDEAIDGLKNAVEEINKLNRTDEKESADLKKNRFSDDKINEVNGLIDNNMNIQEPHDRLSTDMNSNMNFNSDGKPFSEFVKSNSGMPKTSLKDLEEENAILSTMEENVAIANRNMILNNDTKTVINDEGIKKVDRNTNITTDTIVKFDSVIVSKEDAEFFINLVENKNIDLNEVKNAEASSKVSKTLADLLAKSMNENKPVRIDFDNNISVIIRISREGKLSADFLPSSQVAEAYLKENLPLLRQRFDDNNIEYDELNQRRQKQDNQSENRKKGRENE